MSLQDQLRELFLLDQQVRGLRSRLDSALRRQKAQQTRREQLQQQHSEVHDQLRHAQSLASALEKESNGIEQRVTQLREQMNSVRSNKEYSALLVEVNTLKNEKSKLEDQALERLSMVEQLQQKLTEVQEKITQQEKLLQLAQTEVDEARTEVGGRLDEVTAQRDAAEKVVPPVAMAIFKRLADNYEGEALAEVQVQDRRRMEYTCGGCYMSLPIERLNALIMKPDEIVTCPNCNRILYLNVETKEAIKPKA